METGRDMNGMTPHALEHIIDKRLNDLEHDGAAVVERSSQPAPQPWHRRLCAKAKSIMGVAALVVTMLTLGSTTASAHDFAAAGPDGHTIYYNITGSYPNTVAVTYKGDSYSTWAYDPYGTLVIPETVEYDGKTYTVTRLGNQCFYYSDLTKITLPKPLDAEGVRTSKPVLVKAMADSDYGTYRIADFCDANGVSVLQMSHEASGKNK